jgi:hypothetical protein
MTIAAVYALFGEDIRLASTSADSDAVFVVLSSIVFFLFAGEVALLSFAREGYLPMPSCKRKPGTPLKKYCLQLFSVGSFYFWLDVIATVSLIPEVCFLCRAASSILCRTSPPWKVPSTIVIPYAPSSLLPPFHVPSIRFHTCGLHRMMAARQSWMMVLLRELVELPVLLHELRAWSAL